MQASRTEGGCQEQKRAQVGSVLQNFTISYFLLLVQGLCDCNDTKRKENDLFFSAWPWKKQIYNLCCKHDALNCHFSSFRFGSYGEKKKILTESERKLST